MIENRKPQYFTEHTLAEVSVCACLVSLFSRVQLFVVLWTIAHQVLLSMGISGKEYWSGLPCPSPGDLPNPGTEPTSLMFPALAGSFFTTCATWEARRGFRVGNKHLYFGYIASVAPLEWLFFMRTTLDQFFYYIPWKFIFFVPWFWWHSSTFTL